LAQEQAKFQNDFGYFKSYPVMKPGLIYRLWLDDNG